MLLEQVQTDEMVGSVNRHVTLLQLRASGRVTMSNDIDIVLRSIQDQCWSPLCDGQSLSCSARSRLPEEMKYNGAEMCQLITLSCRR